MSKTKLKTKIMEKVVGNPSNTVSIIKKDEPPIDDNIITKPSDQKKTDIKFEYIEKQPLDIESYVYINDDLSRDVGLHRDLNLEYNLSICIYKINHELRTPFLEFYFVKKDGFYQFPETKITFNSIPENADIDTYFLDECSRLYNSKSDKPNENISEIYKGFVDVGSNNIIAVFENPDFTQSTINEKMDVIETTSENPQKENVNVLEKAPVSNNENIQEQSIWERLYN